MGDGGILRGEKFIFDSVSKIRHLAGLFKYSSMNLRWKIAQAAEIRWWRQYLRGQAPEDYLERKAAYWQRVLRAAGLRLRPGERVLDAGCGPAGIFIALPEQQVDALDPLLPRYQAELPLFRPEQYPWVRFLAQPLEQFRPPAVYDTVFCLNAINHVAALGPALDALAACLAQGGQLVLSVDAHRHELLKRLFQWLPGDILHPHQHSLPEYQAMLQSRGLKLERAVQLKPGRIFDYWLMVAGKEV